MENPIEPTIHQLLEELVSLNHRGLESGVHAQIAESIKSVINNVTCHRGHHDYPLTLWDCPVCVQIEKKELEAQLDRFINIKSRVFTEKMFEGFAELGLKIVRDPESDGKMTLKREMMSDPTHLEVLIQFCRDAKEKIHSSQRGSLDTLIESVRHERKQLEAKLAETTKIGEELIDERDDIIASFEVDNAALQRQMGRLQKYATHELGCPVLNKWPQDCTCGLEALEAGDEDEQSQQFTDSDISVFMWPFTLTLKEIAIWATVSDRMRKHLAFNEVAQLEAKNTTLRRQVERLLKWIHERLGYEDEDWQQWLKAFRIGDDV